MIETGFYYHSDREEENYHEDDYFEEYEVADSDIAENADNFNLYNTQAMKKGKKFKDQKEMADLGSDNEEEDEEEEYQKEYSKFPGADKIYHKIIWDEHLDQDEFSVIYEDRFEGNIEEPFCIFQELKEDIPFHRIRFFKKDGEIVWGRKDKINKLWASQLET